MTCWRAVIVAAGLAASAARPQDLPPELLTLVRIKAHMRQELAHIPNYTCVEVVQRYHKPSGRGKSMKPLDTMQLEVAHIGGRELYSWLGDRSFKEGDPTAFIGSGMLSNGIFASHVRSLFVDDQATTFSYRGEEELSGRRRVRYDFRLPVLQSGYTIRVAEARGQVGVKGSFWANRESLDLERMEIHADEIPPTLPIVDAVTIIDYARMRVGTTDALLPQTGDLRVTQFSGVEDHDIIEFTHCKSFDAETKLSFDAAPSPARTAEATIRNIEATETVPAGIFVSTVLTTPLTEHATVGELIEGRVSGDVGYRGTVLIPDGAVVRGRVRRLERHSQSEDYFVVALEFIEIETGGLLLRFFADLQSMDRIPEIEWFLSSSSHDSTDLMHGGRIERTTTEETRLFDLPGVGSFFVRGSRFSLPKGFRMVWKTRAPSR